MDLNLKECDSIWPTTLKRLSRYVFTFLRSWGSKTNSQSDRLSLPNPGRWSSDLGNACLDVYFCLLACCLLAVLFILTSSLSVLEILNILRFKIHEFYHMVCQKTNLFGSKEGKGEMNRVKGTSKTSCNRKGLWTSRQIPECVQIGNHLIPGKSLKMSISGKKLNAN